MKSDELTEAYCKISEDRSSLPDWAVHKKCDPSEPVHPTIPFVGKGYRAETGFLLYASAENLTHYNGYLDDDGSSINRHRSAFDCSVKKSESFFPNVHLQPISDGGLCIAAKYIYSALFGDKDEEPHEFLERIAFGNYCKFSIDSEKRNIDYAGDPKKIAVSRPYIAEDIRILKPRVIVIPKKIYEHEKQFLHESYKDARIIPILQINSTTINCSVVKRMGIPKKQKASFHPACKGGIAGFVPEGLTE